MKFAHQALNFVMPKSHCFEENPLKNAMKINERVKYNVPSIEINRPCIMVAIKGSSNGVIG